MLISLQCSCGKTLHVDDQHRGKKAKCPACGAVLLVEAETAVQAEPPRNLPSSADSESPAPKPKPAPAKRRMMPWLLAGGCGLLTVLSCVLVGAGGGIWYLLFRDSDHDLAFVHADVAGFISVRVADALKNPGVKEQLDRLPIEKKILDKKLVEMKDKFGFTLEDVERATFIMRSVAGDHGPEGAIVIRTSRAMDRKKILAFLDAAKNEKKVDGTIYHVADETGFCFVNDRTLLIAPSEDLLKEFLRSSRRPATQPSLVNGIKLASAGGHLVVAAFRWSGPLMRDALGQADDLQDLRDLTGVTVTGHVDRQFFLEVTGACDSATVANRIKDALTKEHRLELARIGEGPLRGDDPHIAIHRLIESATIEQRGSDVVVKAKADPELRLIIDDVLRALNFQSPGQARSINNLKQIGLAMHNFHDANKRLPGATEKRGDPTAPGLSWRVTLLPYLDEQKLYNEIRHNEAWDSPHNKQFWNKMPKIYQMPGKPNDGKTHYQVFRSGKPGAGFDSAFSDPWPGGGPSGARMVDITDGTSNTFLVVEAADPVPWMKPEDISWQKDQKGVIDRIANPWGSDTFHALMGDGTVRTVRRNLTPRTLEALITRNGNEAFEDRDWLP